MALIVTQSAPVCTMKREHQGDESKSNYAFHFLLEGIQRIILLVRVL